MSRAGEVALALEPFPTVEMGKEHRDVQSGRLGGGGDTRPDRQA